MADINITDMQLTEADLTIVQGGGKYELARIKTGITPFTTESTSGFAPTTRR